jgi:hypothetical protein
MVYSDKAEITRIANVDVSVGECNIEVNDFPDSVDRDSGRYFDLNDDAILLMYVDY